MGAPVHVPVTRHLEAHGHGGPKIPPLGTFYRAGLSPSVDLDVRVGNK